MSTPQTPTGQDVEIGKSDSTPSLRERLIDAMTPGVQIELDPDEAEMLGAFIEDALSDEDADEGAIDLLTDREGNP